jgi:hypothetical protein
VCRLRSDTCLVAIRSDWSRELPKPELATRKEFPGVTLARGGLGEDFSCLDNAQSVASMQKKTRKEISVIDNTDVVSSPAALA